MLFYIKRKSLRQRSNLEKLAKDEAELKLKLKNEQTNKDLLEKYEVLSDFHLKEMNLIGKSKELEQLEIEKKELDEQVELFTKRIAEHEQSILMRQVERKKPLMYDIIKEDLEQLIRKHSYHDNDGDYIHLLSTINDSYIYNLKEKYDGNISVQYIKYCICFAIGMEINEVADCFSIEQASVHGLRYRLKKKFGLEIEDNLELFLKSLTTL